jgi:hypothetical protein
VPALEAGLLVLAAGSLSYLLSRTDAFHAQALFVVIAVLLGLLAARARTLVGPLRWPARIVALVLLAPLIVHSAANRISAAVKPPVLRTLTLPVADGVQAPPAEARAIERMVALVQARVAPGGAIWVAARRSDLIRSGNPLVYVLTQRENPTPEDFGLETPAAAQARIVAELTRARPRMIVRWTDPYSSSREPNLRGRSSGVRTLDTWIGAHYRLLSRLYHYDVLVRR